jgi:glycosyltransferase involved in cell wall biosynthesis
MTAPPVVYSESEAKTDWAGIEPAEELSTACWKVICLDTALFDELSCPDSCEGVWVVFFRNGVALGHCQLSYQQLPLSAAQLAGVAARVCAPATGHYLFDEGFCSALPGLPEPPIQDPEQALIKLSRCERPLQGLEAAVAAPASRLTVSVAVCTRERPRDLARCLAALAKMNDAPHEIVVIDNAPLSDATRQVVASFPGARYCCEPRRGLSAARNTALAQANGDVVAFVDDDAVVHPDWLARIGGSFDDHQVMVATGLVLPAQLETQAQLIFERDFQFFHQGYRRRYFDSHYFEASRAKGAQVWMLGAGANMAIRRKAFELGYRFDTRLGPGIFGGCGEDSEYWYRLLQDGWSCVYEPAACVFHYHRREISDLRRLVHEYMKGHVAALILQFSRSGHWGNLRRLFLQLPTEYLILGLRLIVTGFALENRILFRGVLGCFSGLGFAFALLQDTETKNI